MELAGFNGVFGNMENVQKVWTFIPGTQSDIDYGDNPSIFSIIIFLRFYIVYYVFRQSVRDRFNARLRTSGSKSSKRNFIYKFKGKIQNKYYII